MSEEHAHEPVLTESQRSRLLLDCHRVLVGDPFDPSKPGLVVTVNNHEKTLYGENGNNGLNGTSRRMQKYFWMGAGMLLVLQAYWAWLLAMKSAGH